MTILQLFQDAASSGITDALLYGTGGGVVTMVVQKVLDRKRDKTDIITNQVTMLNQVNEKLMSVVEELQNVACYRENCRERINGSDELKPPKKAKKNEN